MSAAAAAVEAECFTQGLVVASFAGNGLGDPVFEAADDVYQRHYVMVWGFGFPNYEYYQIRRGVEEPSQSWTM